MSILQIENLTKTYGTLTAVRDLNLSLQRGDIMGFVGPNGAGKTTTIKIAATLLEPTSGTVRVDGLDVLESPMEVRRKIGYMPDFFGVYDDLKVWEYMDFFAAAYRLPKAERRQAAADVLELTDLSGKRDAYVESLSRGMKQRLCLAKTLLHDPELLILDEPASGLDPRARIELKEILRDLREMGKTILVSSHILPELADFCDHVAVLEAGRLVVAGSVSDIIAATQAHRTFHVRLVDRQEQALEMLQRLPGVLTAGQSDGSIEVSYGGESGQEHGMVSELVKAGYEVLAFVPEQMDLEDVFMKVTTGAVQ